MKIMLRRLLLTVLFCGVPVQAADLAPDALVKATTEEVLSIVRQDRDIQSGDRKKILDLLDAKVLPLFDFGRMTRLAVGRPWREATPTQRQALTGHFRELLVRTYSAAFSSYTYQSQSVEFKPFRMENGATDVKVGTAIIRPNTPPLPVDYGMYKTPDGWKVYDVVVEGVSLVTTYRGTFSDEIRRGGIDGLIKSLEDKNRSLAQQDAAGGKAGGAK